MNHIYDTHCHPNLNKIKESEEIIKNFFENWWKYMNIIWTNLKTCSDVLKLSNINEWIYTSIWIHPCDIYDLDLEATIKKLEKLLLINRKKIVAIWECWLDYYWMEKELEPLSWILSPTQEKEATEIIKLKKEKQELFFKAQINLAKKNNLPIIIHNRDSKDDVLRILKETSFKNFIFHCYSENLEYAEKLIEFSPNCKISFSGIVTFKNAKEIQETAKNIPLINILAETDSPYLTPTPFRWKEENEPLFTKYIIEKISNLRWKDCSKEILENSMEIFCIKK